MAKFHFKARKAAMQVDINSYQDIGNYLREVRESVKLDIREAARQLNIRAKYLVALEEGTLDVMPGKVYTRGYLQHYAEFLGINKEQIAEAYDRVAEGGKMRYFVPEPTGRSYQPGMLIVLVALAVVTVVYFYWYKTHKEILVPPEHEMVSPVPQRLLDPVVESPGTLENDDAFVGTSWPYTSGLQADDPLHPEGGQSFPSEPVTLPPQDQQTEELPAPMEEVAPAAAVKKKTRTQGEPKKTINGLPWLKEKRSVP